MSLRNLLLGGGLLGLALAFVPAGWAEPVETPAPDKKAAAKKPQVEVVFCLDTTGSMGGLIEARQAEDLGHLQPDRRRQADAPT